jgi:hypothetical protein
MGRLTIGNSPNSPEVKDFSETNTNVFYDLLHCLLKRCGSSIMEINVCRAF